MESLQAKSSWCVVSTMSALAMGQPAFAGAFSISPIRIELSAAERTQALTVRNEQDSAVTVELHVQTWTQHDGEDQLADTREVLTTPPVFTLPGKGEQIIRVALRRDADPTHELAYRLIVKEVPEATSTEFMGLRVALKLSLPIFVSAREHAQDAVMWTATRLDDGRLRIEANNTGSAHLQVTDFIAQIDVDQAHPLRAPVSKYLLAGTRASWTLNPSVDIANDAPLKLTGYSDRGEFSAVMQIVRP